MSPVKTPKSPMTVPIRRVYKTKMPYSSRSKQTHTTFKHTKSLSKFIVGKVTSNK